MEGFSQRREEDGKTIWEGRAKEQRARALKGWGTMIEIPGLVLIQRIHLFNNNPRVKWLEELA